MATETVREYTTLDRSGWGSGPWDGEPDKVQWVDAATGLDCLAVRAPGGHWCGYVGVPPEHPWHGLDYDADALLDVDVHGGLTYAAACQEDASEQDAICHVPLNGRPDSVWWFGFDCAHLGDLSPKYARDAPIRDEVYRRLDYVKCETADLARQLQEAVPGADPASTGPRGPDGRPDCGYCAERLRVNVGLMEENRQLRRDGISREDVRSALEDLRIEFQGFVHEPERRAALLTLDRVEAAVLGSGDGSSPVGGDSDAG
jgi:hypothetical protein